VNYTNLGTCSNCGECCSDFLHLDDEEIKRIDEYLIKHKIQQSNKGENNLCCPFRDDFLKKCNIYEARPYICRVFKCDTPPEKAIRNRDEINKNKKPRSMAELFFKDESKIEFAKKNIGIKLFKRGE
jgi:Fe-S-cluster containining protein